MRPITDRSGRVIAYPQDVNEHRPEIRSRSNALRGHVKPQEGPSRKTFDRSARAIGSGDQRGRFIPDE